VNVCGEDLLGNKLGSKYSRLRLMAMSSGLVRRHSIVAYKKVHYRLFRQF